MDDRRRNKRIELESRILVKRLDQAENEEINIEITDVSKTGVGFLSRHVFTIGAVYEAYLTIWTKEVLHAFIEIVRIEKSGKTFEYGGIFVGMPQSDVQRIEVYEMVQEATEQEEE